MKKIFLFSLFLSQSILSQVVEPAYAPIKADTNIIRYKIAEFENYINSCGKSNFEHCTTFIDKDYFRDLQEQPNFKEKIFTKSKVSIRIKEVSVENGKGKIICEYLYYDDVKVFDPIMDTLMTEKKNNWVITNLGKLEQIFTEKYRSSESVNKEHFGGKETKCKSDYLLSRVSEIRAKTQNTCGQTSN